MVKLASVAKIETGFTPPTQDASNYGSEFCFASPADISDDKYVYRTKKGLSQRGFDGSRRFPAGSVLFVCIGSTIGKCAIATCEMTSNQQINAVIPSGLIDSEFVYYWLSAVANKVRASASEQAVPLVSKSQFSLLEIPVPPIPEQRAIAEALGDVDALIAAQQKLIAKKRAIKTATMQRLLTGKQRLPGFDAECGYKLSDVGTLPADWNIAQLKTVVENSRPICYGILMPGPSTPGGVPVVKVTDIKGGIIDQEDLHLTTATIDEAYRRSRLKAGDVLLTIRGTTGRVAVVPPILDRANITQDTARLSMDLRRARPRYIFYALLSTRLQRFIELHTIGQAVRGINIAEVKKIPLLLPSLPEQDAIAQVLTDMDAEITALETRLDKTKDIKQGMMQELLTGRTRLV